MSMPLYRPREPAGVAPGLAAALEPERDVVVEVRRVVDPPALRDVVPSGGGDRVVFASPRDVRQELCHHPSVRRVVQVLAVLAPPVVERRLNIRKAGVPSPAQVDERNACIVVAQRRAVARWVQHGEPRRQRCSSRCFCEGGWEKKEAGHAGEAAHRACFLGLQNEGK